MTTDPAKLGAEIVDACRALGFAAAGITDAAPTSHEAELRDWLAAGKHGDMSWMTELLPERLDPTRMLPGARSLIMVADQYEPPTAADPSPSEGRIAAYAQGRDYHATVKRRLHRLADELRKRHRGHEFRSFVDTGPVLEREHAAHAGLGWIGKHTLLIHPRLGSYLLLGGIATTLYITPPPDQPPPPSDHCGACTRCIDACPTDAITPYSVDARRCISYLTIEHPGPIDPALEPAMGDWLFGCDICQQVCPFNTREPEPPVFPAYRSGRRSLPILEVLGWEAAAYSASVSGSSMKRARLEMMKRNALIAAANAALGRENHGILAAIGRVAADAQEPELVRETAKRVLKRLGEGGSGR